MATLASMSTSAFDACHAAVSTAAASAGLVSPRISAAVARTITSSFVRRARSRRSTVALRFGRLRGGQRLHRRRPGAPVGVVEIRLPRRLGHRRRRACRARSRPRRAPSSRDPDRHPTAPAGTRAPSIAASAVTAAARIVGDGIAQSIEQPIDRRRRLQRTERGHDLELQRRIERRLVEQRDQRRDRARIAEAAEAADGLQPHRGPRRRRRQHVEQRRHGDRPAASTGPSPCAAKAAL